MKDPAKYLPVSADDFTLSKLQSYLCKLQVPCLPNDSKEVLLQRFRQHVQGPNQSTSSNKFQDLPDPCNLTVVEIKHFLSMHNVEHPSHARRSSLVELYEGLSKNQSKTSTSSVGSVYLTPQLSTPSTAMPLRRSPRLAQKDSIRSSLKAQRRSANQEDYFLGSKALSSGGSKKRSPHRQRTPVAESKKRQCKESRTDNVSPSPLGAPNLATDLESPPAKAPCQPSRPRALDLTSIKAVCTSLQVPLNAEAEKYFSSERLVSPPDKSANESPQLSTPSTAMPLRRSPRFAQKESIRSSVKSQLHSANPGDDFFSSKGVSPGGSQKPSPHRVKEPVAESQKTQCPETRNDISSSSPLGPPKLTTDLKKQPGKPPSQRSSPCALEITSVQRGVLLHELLGAAPKEAFISPTPFLSSSSGASNQSLPASPAEKGNISPLPTSNLNFPPTDPTPPASVWTFPLMPKNVQGTSGRADIHSAENATSEPNDHIMDRPQIVEGNGSDDTRTHLFEPGGNVRVNHANEEAHNNDTSSEALAASLLRSGQITPSRPSPPMPSIPMCRIHDGTEPDCPPPGKRYRQTNVSENGSTNIVQCLSLEDCPDVSNLSTREIKAYLRKNHSSFKASERRSQLVHKYHHLISRNDHSSTQRGAESQVAPSFSASFVNASQAPPVVSNTPTNLTWSNPEDPPRPSPPMPCTPSRCSHDNTEPDCPTSGKRCRKTHVPAIASTNSAQCSTLTEWPDVSTLSARQIKAYLHNHNRTFKSTDRRCQLVYKYKHLSGQSSSPNQNQYSSCTQASQETKEVPSGDKSPTANAPSSSYVQSPVDLEHTDNVSLGHMENYLKINNFTSQRPPRRARLKANYHILLSQNAPNTQSHSEGPPSQSNNNPTNSCTSFSAQDPLIPVSTSKTPQPSPYHPNPSTPTACHNPLASPTYIPHTPIESTSAVPYNPLASNLAVPFDSISDPPIPTRPSQGFDSIHNSPHQPVASTLAVQDNSIYNSHTPTCPTQTFDSNCNPPSHQAAPRDLDSSPSIPSWRDGISAPTDPHCSANLQEVVGALKHFTNQASEQNSKIIRRMDLIVDKLSAIDFNPLPFTNSSTPSPSSHGRANIPPPATPEERAHWNCNTDPEIESDSSEEDDHPDSPLRDPQFPYPGGPGHREASQQTLKIIWRAMRSFQPSLGEPFTTPENRFCWTFAFKLFLKLVSCGEYEGINLDITNEQVIWNALRNHVQNRLMSKYRQQQWSADHKEKHKKMCRRLARLTKTRQARVSFLLTQPPLMALIPIVEECCSDDETADEYEEERPNRPNSKNSQRKQCNILKLPWRHPCLDRIMQIIDKLRQPVDDQNPNTPKNSRSRIRQHPREVATSTIEAKSGLPASCYNPLWLQTQPLYEVRALQMKPAPVLHPFLQILESL
ncbi:hypothetical protein O181_017834 [Austropuccinia psidii MF-1]|uniref:Uncharacterized protein n=1 Tax=Austropuccinia psidii MF-1 TaxID=1389203 RepID=A0A9Q3GT62_9BASI|nr:hypothetical protein [Austropuccinia psidii MF-1]